MSITIITARLAECLVSILFPWLLFKTLEKP